MKSNFKKKSWNYAPGSISRKKREAIERKWEMVRLWDEWKHGSFILLAEVISKVDEKVFDKCVENVRRSRSKGIY